MFSHVSNDKIIGNVDSYIKDINPKRENQQIESKDKPKISAITKNVI